MIRRCWRSFWDLWEDDAASDRTVYDPVQVGLVLVGCLTGFGVLYWTLWALLVCEGGLFGKIGPWLAVVFTSRTLADYGVRGSPYALGIFEGWIVNLGGLVAAALITAGIGRILSTEPRTKKSPSMEGKSRTEDSPSVLS